MKKPNNIIKNINLDHVRLILAFMIIAIHTYPLTCISEFTDYLFTRILFRIAVPIYLIITGYFVLDKALEDKEVLIRYIKKIICIYMLSFLLYFKFHFANISDLLEIATEFFFKGTFYHLWYFPALILGILVTYLIIKYLPKRIQLGTVFALYFIGLFGDNYYGFISHVEVINKFYEITNNITGYTRNFLFYVPIFLFLGYIIKKENNTIEKTTNIDYIKKFVLLLIYEGSVCYFFKTSLHTSMYMSLPFLAYFIFKYIIPRINKDQDKVLRRTSTFVYVLHPLVIIVLTKFKFIKIIDNSFIFYILVCICSFTISHFLSKVVLKNMKATY